MEGIVFFVKALLIQNTPPPKPTDRGKEVHVSFYDKVLGTKAPPPVCETTDLIKKNLVCIEYVNGIKLLPNVIVNDEIFKELYNPWEDALVVKLLGKNIGYKTMKEKLCKVWKLSEEFDIMDVDNGYYMVKLDLPEDKEKVIKGGPWMIFDHYLTVSQWTVDFSSPSARVC